MRPLDAMAAYVPSGRYPLPSTVLMTVIPAQVAGVPRICVASPRPSPEILGTAGYLGVEQGLPDGRRARHRGVRLRHRDRAQGGPHRRTGQHLRRGGEEAARRRSRHRLRGRADRDPDHRRRRRSRRCWPRTCWPRPSTTWRPPPSWSRPTQAAGGGRGRGGRGAVADAADGADRARGHRAQQRHHPGRRRSTAPWSFRTASRRSTSASRTRACSAGITNAGSVFIGPYSPEAAGDYASGPNHVLPTSGYARVRAGLSSADFVKVISVQELSRAVAGEPGARHHDAGAGRGARSARPLRGGAPPWLKAQPAGVRARARPCCGWRRIRRPRRAGRASCAWTSTRTPSAARRA